MKMKIFAFVLAAVLWSSFPVSAAEKTPGVLASLGSTAHPEIGISSPSSEDAELAAKRAEFKRFAKEKVKQFNRLLLFTKDKMQITRQADGSYLARYHQIEDASIGSTIRRSGTGSGPFVGILSYREQVFENHGQTPDDCRKGEFSLAMIIPNRHIFSYSKGAWH